MTVEDGHLGSLQPGDDPDFRVAAEGPLQGAVGLEAAVIQVCMPVLPAGGSANVYVQHELQAFHYLDKGSADAGLPEQEGIIAAVVEALGAVSGRPEDIWVVGLDGLGKSWFHI